MDIQCRYDEVRIIDMYTENVEITWILPTRSRWGISSERLLSRWWRGIGKRKTLDGNQLRKGAVG